MLDNIPLTMDLKHTGIYYMGGDGATGKTYLADLIYCCSILQPTDYLRLSYHNTENQDFYLKHINNFNGKYLFLDRADLYWSDAIYNAVKDKDCVTFIDLKNVAVWRRMQSNYCGIEFDADRLRVFDI